MEIKLVVEKGVHCGLELVKTEAGRYHIGRSREAALALVQDDYVSHEHCRIEFSGTGALLQHSGGRSGTFLNSKPVHKAYLRHGDCLVIGRSLVRVYLSGVSMPSQIVTPPASIEGFELVKPLPADGPGQTWWAASTLSDHIVTLHLLPMDLRDERAMQRFLREAETCARLRHPGLLRFRQQGISGNVLWFATDLVEGNTLEQYIASYGPLAANRAVALMQQMMDIMSYLHQERVVHRALRPASVRVNLRGELRLQLTDLGCAKCFYAEELQRLTHTGEYGFTINPYTAPEALIDSKSMDPRIDLYALGGLLYFMLTGRHLYHMSPNQDLVLTILETAPEPLFILKPDLPQGIIQVVEKALAREPDARYSTVDAMHHALIPDFNTAPESLRRQLANAKENYQLIEERESEFVDKPPLDLVKDKQRWGKAIADLEARLRVAEQS